jgi:hypothetical protein
MIHWLWLCAAFVVGFWFGFLALAILSMAGDDDDYLKYDGGEK